MSKVKDEPLRATLAAALFAAGVVLALALAGCITPQQTSEVIGAVSNAVADVINHNPPNGPTPAVVTPTNQPGPIVVPVTPDPATNAPEPLPVNSAQVRAAMFVSASGSPYTDTINCGVTSAQGWVSSHGRSWENGYRADILARLQSAGSRWLVYIADDGYRGAPVLQMCLSDRVHPDVPGKHMVPDEGWFDRSMARDVDSHIVVVRDSPDSGVSVSEQTCRDIVDAYTGTRFKEVIYLVGLECKRNQTAEQSAQMVRWLRAAAPKARVVVGDQSADYLLQVSALCDAELWLEQPTHPTQQPLTLATAPAYIAQLDRLAARVGPGRTWAGEWWASSQADRRTITAQILAKGFNCGCGDFGK